MVDEKVIAEDIYRALKELDIGAVCSLISDRLKGEKTEKMGFTKTPLLNSVGRALGRLLQKEPWRFEKLKALWDAGGRDERLIVIGALGVLSKRDYDGVKGFVLLVLEDISDWEICDQLALKVVVNLALKSPEELFSLMRGWSGSENKWTRRLSVAVIPPYIRADSRGVNLCLDLLESVMKDPDRDVRKAVGWALRELSKKDVDAVYNFLCRWAAEKDAKWVIKDGMKKLPEDKQIKLLSLL